MEITLEKIELVKDRTGVTYKEAKDALEAAEGNVVDAIISIEDKVDSQTSSKKLGAKGDALITKIKEVIRKGNVSRIQVSKENEKILNIPLSAGVVGAVIFPWPVLIGVVAAFGFKCQVTVVMESGEVLDITDKAGNIYEDAKAKGSEVADKIKEKAPEVADKIKEKAPEVADKIVEKGGEAVNMAKDAAKDAAEKIMPKKDDQDKE